MSEEDALLAAIAAQPDEDTPRLAYADWLDEHGRHARAEFIRVQIEVARVETLPRALVERHVDLFKRQQELIDHHRDELLYPMVEPPDDVKIEFHRGFVSEVAAHVWRYLHHAVDIAGLRPLPAVRVRDVAAYVIQSIDDAPSAFRPLTICAALEMQSQHNAYPNELTDVHIRGLFATGLAWGLAWDHLREVNLEGCQIGDRGLDVLARQPNLPRLTDLDLSVNRITRAGVRLLVESPLWPRLTRLVLGGNPIDDESAYLLADAAGTSRLEYLNLRFTQIGPPGQQALLARFGGRIDLF